jgi:hypothetical protein
MEPIMNASQIKSTSALRCACPTWMVAFIAPLMFGQTLAETPSESNAVIPAARKISTEELPGHIRKIHSILSIRQRETDPFGKLQDPDAKPIVKPSMTASKRVVPQATPFVDIINMIKVTTIMPGERRFLIGNRSVTQGESIPLQFRGRNIPVEVVSVTSDRIDFRKIDNGETAELKIKLLPDGMKPGSDGIHAPGMVRDNPDAPIDLDGESLPMDAAQYSR